MTCEDHKTNEFPRGVAATRTGRKVRFRKRLGVINRVLGTSSDEDVSGEEKVSLKLATFDVNIDVRLTDQMRDNICASLFSAIAVTIGRGSGTKSMNVKQLLPSRM